MTDHRFFAREHVRRGDDFRKVYEARHSVASGPLVAYALPNGLGWNRIGLSVSKRVGCAVIRNLTKAEARRSIPAHQDNPGDDFRLRHCREVGRVT